jgi:transaldolase
MPTPLESLVASGTKLWLDSVDPEEVTRNRAWGATGATSNPIIISDLIETGRFDDQLAQLIREGLSDHDLAWKMTDVLVGNAQKVFLPTWAATRGTDGYVSFELDPLLEDPDNGMPVSERTRHYIALGKQWSQGQKNRMIKIPNTDGGVGALEELAAAGVTINVTLTFSMRQYVRARDAIWRGVQRAAGSNPAALQRFKSVYSIFVSRVDVYTEHHVPELSPQAQGMVGIVNAKEIWHANQQFWADKKLPLKQEIIFASTGVKKPSDPPWKYVEAFAGSDIETNPPKTNDDVQASGRTITRQIDKLPPDTVLQEIARKVDAQKMEDKLMEEGIKKFADPFKALLKTLAKKRADLRVAVR